jgi:hypothetical protein
MSENSWKALVPIREFIETDIYGRSSTNMSISPEPEVTGFQVSVRRLPAVRAIAL